MSQRKGGSWVGWFRKLSQTETGVCGASERVLSGLAQIRKRKEVKIGQREELDCEVATTRPQPTPRGAPELG